MIRTQLTVLAFASALGCIGPAAGQSIYVDIDIGIGDPALGNGAPSSAFGGAAGIPGFWNRVQADSDGPFALKDATGSPTGVVLTAHGGGGATGYRNTTNTGDYALWLNDGERIGGSLIYTVTGLAPGSYRVFTAAVQPQGGVDDAFITVPGSSTTNPQLVTGPMPGNQLIQGITHSVHDIDFSGGALVISAAGDDNAYVNGFQIEAAPEPATVSAFALALAGFAARRKRRM
ncbi:MAG: PEP-CTERM sorting domain-containing protein [Fimbriimonadales bacterium]